MSLLPSTRCVCVRACVCGWREKCNQTTLALLIIINTTIIILTFQWMHEVSKEKWQDRRRRRRQQYNEWYTHPYIVFKWAYIDTFSPPKCYFIYLNGHFILVQALPAHSSWHVCQNEKSHTKTPTKYTNTEHFTNTKFRKSRNEHHDDEQVAHTHTIFYSSFTIFWI